jgi:NADH:ubiquinone oxidoreductase subunit 5 (subunit L)/multisubunit Na+/H+ antiporter MnhA subunit
VVHRWLEAPEAQPDPEIAIGSTLLALPRVDTSSTTRRGKKAWTIRCKVWVIYRAQHKWGSTNSMACCSCAFIRISNFLADAIDWRFLHDWFHERAIRDTFLKMTDFLANPIDKLVIDGAVNGTGRLVAWASGGLRKMQTGYVAPMWAGGAGWRGSVAAFFGKQSLEGP